MTSGHLVRLQDSPPEALVVDLFYAWLVSESVFNRANEPLLTPMSEKSPLHGAYFYLVGLCSCFAVGMGVEIPFRRQFRGRVRNTLPQQHCRYSSVGRAPDL